MIHKNKRNAKHIKIFIYVKYIGLNENVNTENFKLHT